MTYLEADSEVIANARQAEAHAARVTRYQSLGYNTVTASGVSGVTDGTQGIVGKDGLGNNRPDAQITWAWATPELTAAGKWIFRNPSDVNPSYTGTGWAVVETLTSPATPVNTSIPTISGFAYAGQSVTAGNGSWTNSPTVFEYRWLLNDSVVSGQTDSTFACLSTQDGQKLNLEVRAQNASGWSNWVKSSDAYVINWFLWYEGDSTVLSGADITQFVDKGVNGNSCVVQATTNRRADAGRTINGLVAVDCDGGDSYSLPSSYISAIGASPHTIFFIGQTDNAAGQQWLFGSGVSTATRQGLGFNINGTFTAICNSTLATNSNSNITIDTSPHIYGAQRVGQGVISFVDGVTYPAAATNNPGVDRAAMLSYSHTGSTFFDGAFGRILVAMRCLSDNERNYVGKIEQVRYNTPAWTSGTRQISIATFGDSITQGTGASVAANRWANLVATSRNALLSNQGISGTVTQNTNLTTTGLPQTNNGRDRYISALLGANSVDEVYLLYGVNDSYLKAVNQPSLNVTEFSNDYQEIISGLLAAGIPATKITIGTPPYYTIVSNQASQEEHATAVRALAVANGIKFADVRQAMIDSGWGSLNSGDNLHPNDAGHAVIANSMLSATYVT